MTDYTIHLKSHINAIKSKAYDINVNSSMSIKSVIFKSIKETSPSEIGSYTESNFPYSSYDLTFSYKKNSSKDIDIQKENLKNLDETVEQLKKRYLEVISQETFNEAYFTITKKYLIDLPAYIIVTISYSGPIFIILYFYFSNYTPLFVQTVAMILSVIHYAKRVYESNYVNYYEGNFEVAALGGLIFYYWILYGVNVSYNLFHPDYTNDQSIIITLICAAGFLFCAYNNYACHMILKNLKIVNKGKRGIPQGNAFNYVSCAHYFWELLTWVCMFFMIRTISSLIFVGTSFASMFAMAMEKHKGYKSYFKEEYPNRKIMIPFLL